MKVKKVTIEYDNEVIITGPSLESVSFLCELAVENKKLLDGDPFAEGTTSKRSFYDPEGATYYSEIV